MLDVLEGDYCEGARKKNCIRIFKTYLIINLFTNYYVGPRPQKTKELKASVFLPNKAQTPLGFIYNSNC